jgi:organic hydroperoxide reductase OsmC/OhrA
MNISIGSVLGLIYVLSELGLTLKKRAKAGEARDRDRGSLRLLWIVITLSTILAFNFAYAFPAARMGTGFAMRDLGVVLFVAGLIIRWYSIFHPSFLYRCSNGVLGLGAVPGQLGIAGCHDRSSILGFPLAHARGGSGLIARPGRPVPGLHEPHQAPDPCRLLNPFTELPMHPFPHHYVVNAAVRPDGDVPLSAEGVRIIESAPPKEFDGPGNQWSPEGLLTAAVADCFVLSFRAIAAASKFTWSSLESRTKGTLDRIEGKMRFTRFDTHAKLHVPAGGDIERAKKLLEKAEMACLVANSLSSERHLTVEVVVS